MQGIPGILNRNVWFGNIAAVEEIGLILRNFVMVEIAMFDPNAK